MFDDLGPWLAGVTILFAVIVFGFFLFGEAFYDWRERRRPPL